MLMPKEVSDTSERQVVTHNYVVSNFSVMILAENLGELVGVYNTLLGGS